MGNMTAEPGMTLSREWRELLVDAAGGRASLAALASARSLRAVHKAYTLEEIYKAPTLEETEVAIQGFFELDSEQAAAVMTRLAGETALPDNQT